MAQCCVFDKQSVGPIHCGPCCQGHPFSRSYGARLPSSLTGVHSCALVYSTHPPVSVCGTGTLAYAGTFPGGLFEGSGLTEVSPSACAPATFNRQALSKAPSFRFKFRWCGNINPLSIAYASPPRLRSRLTLGRLAWPRKPWVYGGPGFHRPSRYLCLHALLSEVHFQSPSSFNPQTMLSYHTIGTDSNGIRSFGIPLDRQSFSARDHSMSQLLRTV